MIAAHEFFPIDDIRIHDASVFLKKEILVYVHVKFPDRYEIQYLTSVDLAEVMSRIQHLESLSDAERLSMVESYEAYVQIATEQFANYDYVNKLDHVKYVRYLAEILSNPHPVNSRIIHHIWISPGKIEMTYREAADITDMNIPPVEDNIQFGVLLAPEIINRSKADLSYSFRKYIETVCFISTSLTDIDDVVNGRCNSIRIIKDFEFYPLLSEANDGSRFTLFALMEHNTETAGYVFSDCYFLESGDMVFDKVTPIPKFKLNQIKQLLSTCK